MQITSKSNSVASMQSYNDYYIVWNDATNIFRKIHCTFMTWLQSTCMQLNNHKHNRRLVGSNEWKLLRYFHFNRHNSPLVWQCLQHRTRQNHSQFLKLLDSLSRNFYFYFYFSINSEVDFHHVVKLLQDETLTLTLTQNGMERVNWQ